MVSIVKRDPSTSLPTFEGLQREMNRLLENAFKGFSDAGPQVWSPPVELLDTGNEFIIQVELPGFERDQVDIELENGMLTLSGERKPPELEGSRCHRSERWYGRFERSFSIPAAVEADQVKAELKSGILTVQLPKRKEAQPKQIRVTTS